METRQHHLESRTGNYGKSGNTRRQMDCRSRMTNVFSLTCSRESSLLCRLAMRIWYIRPRSLPPSVHFLSAARSTSFNDADFQRRSSSSPSAVKKKGHLSGIDLSRRPLHSFSRCHFYSLAVVSRGKKKLQFHTSLFILSMMRGSRSKMWKCRTNTTH